ncbi:MAG: uracil-DNA glycosylase [Treponema sp.]|jgi:DNA polymerase|nr:uracil-DNA glycosylase [Treponema sp.]
MTAEQKNTLNGFLNIAEDYLSGGYRAPRAVCRYTDDPAPSCNGRLPEDSETGRLSPEPAAGEEKISALAVEIKDCGACPLSKHRKQALSGTGAEKPLVLVAADCPGPEDDREGRVFAGETGALLDRMLKAIGLFREKNCFITYLVKCLPSPGHAIDEAERLSCEAFLKRELSCLKPRAVLALGASAGARLKGLGGSKESSLPSREDMRGRFFSCLGIPLLVTYHPAEVMLNTALKAPVWKDLQQLQAKLGEPEE